MHLPLQFNSCSGIKSIKIYANETAECSRWIDHHSSMWETNTAAEKGNLMQVANGLSYGVHRLRLRVYRFLILTEVQDQRW